MIFFPLGGVFGVDLEGGRRYRRDRANRIEHI